MGIDDGFGERLMLARQRAKLTQGQLGEGLGTDGADVPKSVVYGWERRGHRPRVDQLGLICSRLNCSADWLVRGVNPAWPFSADLRKALDRLTARDLVKMENLMRAPLEMPTLPLPELSDTHTAAVENANDYELGELHSEGRKTTTPHGFERNDLPPLEKNRGKRQA